MPQRTSLSALGLPLALALALSAAAPAQAQYWWLDDNGGPAYAQAGFARYQIMAYARVQVAMDRGMSFEDAVADTDGIDAKTYELITKAAKGSPAIQQSINIMKRRVSGQ